jgi:hypothetical protein
MNRKNKKANSKNKKQNRKKITVLEDNNNINTFVETKICHMLTITNKMLRRMVIAILIHELFVYNINKFIDFCPDPYIVNGKEPENGDEIIQIFN